ncbi:MAG TPA: pyridoxamine 5'-phosphate oxidase family protein [Pyrinomonadaceae bacterium]|jgi:nitroimidazol reductase NimA-like FMN-containing flavoprotein (pyridoxamine 5'-phosphate oxidase superfamily)
MQIIKDTGSHFDLEDEAARRFIDEVLARPLFAHLATVAGQWPRESPVWFLWEEGALWIIGNYRTDSFPRRLEEEPRCAVGIVDFNLVTGRVHHVGFRGRARLEPHDAARMTRLLRRYLGEPGGWDSRFAEILDDADYIFVCFEPETAVVRDQSYSVSGAVGLPPS